LTPYASTSAPETSALQVEVLVTNMTYHTSEDHSLRYDEIYIIFNTIYFPPDDEDLEAYQNIQNNEIHLVVVRSGLFPCNEEAQWFLSGLTLALPQF
jgi:hypothetical protein